VGRNAEVREDRGLPTRLASLATLPMKGRD